MKAIRAHEAGGPEVLRLEEVPDPQPGPGQVVVSVKAVGVNPVDTYIRSGRYANAGNFPYTPGSDAAGIIESAGEGVTRVAVGDRVYTSGTLTGAYAEKALCKDSQVHPLPERNSFSQGAAIGVPYATAFRALIQRAQGKAGESVLVHGATGGVGTAAVEIAKAYGFMVVGTGGTEEGRELIKNLGAHHALDHHAPDYLQQGVRLIGGEGFDVILEMLANVNLDKDLSVLAKGGRVAVIGSRGRIEIDPRQTMGRDAAILGVYLLNATEKELQSIHAALRAGLENGTLNPIIGQEIPLAEAPRAHEAIMEPGAHGKIVLIP
jgi:NADPH2:quinone reductase